MGAISLGMGDCRLGSNHRHHQAAAAGTGTLSSSSSSHRHGSSSGNVTGSGVVIDEVEGLIRVYKDGRVERPPVVKEVPATWSPVPGVASGDVVIDPGTRLWARVHVPTGAASSKPLLPLVVYFHGGGFCVGSAAWSCYHEFLSHLALSASCVVVSVNYRLAPEHRLPAAFEDGYRAVKWVIQMQQRREDGDDGCRWWASRCDFTTVFLAGDSAGATIAHNVSTRLADSPWIHSIRGTVLIQPFFGGETRTWSERYLTQPPGSALTLAASDAYWRMSLPAGATRDHTWCNPLADADQQQRRLPAVLVCIAEADILRDRTADFCRAARKAGGTVDQIVHDGVGHAFHVLHVHTSGAAQARLHDMLTNISTFMDRQQQHSIIHRR